MNAYVTSLLLMLSGDIKLNPGPTLEFIANALARLETSQNTMLTELSLIRSAQPNIENLVSRLSCRVDALEKIIEANRE